MGRYQVLLSPEVENAYEKIAQELDMSMDQTLTAALQLYASGLLLENLPGMADDCKLRNFANREVG